MTEPLDVWLLLDEEDPDALAICEANTYEDDGQYRVEWYHNDVGLVTSVWFHTYEEAQEWLTERGYQDFSS